MLVEPVELADFFMSFFSAAMIIFTATLYAVLYAWARLRGKRGVYFAAGLAYLALLVCVALFSRINHLSGHWQWLSLTMVVGYALMPSAIWNLCVATHRDDDHH